MMRTSTKLVFKRLAVWACEVSLEALFLGLLLVALVANKDDVGRGTSNIIATIGKSTVIFAAVIAWGYLLTGYLVTTAVSRAVWRNRKLWSYSAVAVALFLIHFEILNAGLGGAFGPHERIRFVAAGASFTIVCTLAGSFLLRKWEPQH
jgi:hypothetical protein